MVSSSFLHILMDLVSEGDKKNLNCQKLRTDAGVVKSSFSDKSHAVTVVDNYKLQVLS
jgi:hypothetical protein